MNGVRTRKQKTQAAIAGTQRLNGHANPRDHDGGTPEAPENIFLFYPNIIGEHWRLQSSACNEKLI